MLTILPLIAFLNILTHIQYFIQRKSTPKKTENVKFRTLPNINVSIITSTNNIFTMCTQKSDILHDRRISDEEIISFKFHTY